MPKIYVHMYKLSLNPSWWVTATVIQLSKTGCRAFQINHSTCDSGTYYITVLVHLIFHRTTHPCYLILFFITLHLNASRQLCDNILTSPIGCFQLTVNGARFHERRNKITILWQNVADFGITFNVGLSIYPFKQTG